MATLQYAERGGSETQPRIVVGVYDASIYVASILKMLKKGNVKELYISGRGRLVSKVLDVKNILKNELPPEYDIENLSLECSTPDNDIEKSELTITVKKHRG